MHGRSPSTFLQTYVYPFLHTHTVVNIFLKTWNLNTHVHRGRKNTSMFACVVIKGAILTEHALHKKEVLIYRCLTFRDFKIKVY